jgi:hypothetical protein
MTVLAYLGDQCTTFYAAGSTCWFLMSFYLESCIWHDAISGSSEDAACQRLREALSDRLSRCNVLVQGQQQQFSKLKVQTHRDRKRRDRWRAKSRACTFSLISGGSSTKNWSWQSKQSILHTTVTFYCECLKMCEDFAPDFGDKSSGSCIKTTHRLTIAFSLGNF